VILYGRLARVVEDLFPAAGIPKALKRTGGPFDYNNRKRRVSNQQAKNPAFHLPETRLQSVEAILLPARLLLKSVAHSSM
jgi:hypothetical protein